MISKSFINEAFKPCHTATLQPVHHILAQKTRLQGSRKLSAGQSSRIEASLSIVMHLPQNDNNASEVAIFVWYSETLINAD